MKYKKKRILILSIALVLTVGVIIVYFVDQKKHTFVISITVPAGSEEGFYCMDGGVICYSSNLKLKPDKNNPNIRYMLYDADAFFLSDGRAIDGKSVIDPVEKKSWFIFDVIKKKDYKIGVYTSNASNEDIVISFEVYNVDLWID